MPKSPNKRHDLLIVWVFPYGVIWHPPTTILNRVPVHSKFWRWYHGAASYYFSKTSLQVELRSNSMWHIWEKSARRVSIWDTLFFSILDREHFVTHNSKKYLCNQVGYRRRSAHNWIKVQSLVMPNQICRLKCSLSRTLVQTSHTIDTVLSDTVLFSRSDS